MFFINWFYGEKFWEGHDGYYGKASTPYQSKWDYWVAKERDEKFPNEFPEWENDIDRYSYHVWKEGDIWKSGYLDQDDNWFELPDTGSSTEAMLICQQDYLNQIPKDKVKEAE